MSHLPIGLPLVHKVNEWITRKQCDLLNRRRVQKLLEEAAILCKQHLRSTNPETPILVEEFILSIEGAGTDHDVRLWGQFRDISDQYKNIADIREEMLKRLDRGFDLWCRNQR